ncbi:Programmed Cell Death 6-Interacting Protein [Manis pentadactyla]|nr:Programmed Cell Death 6-Interacting Protein [Manis pentadactyla]
MGGRELKELRGRTVFVLDEALTKLKEGEADLNPWRSVCFLGPVQVHAWWKRLKCSCSQQVLVLLSLQPEPELKRLVQT